MLLYICYGLKIVQDRRVHAAASPQGEVTNRASC